jgi:asparagine synthase (glutamine-hydrolysing)
MCGICGILNFDQTNKVDQATLVRMRDTMIHRGPDDEGIYLNDNVGFGFRRLKIIDLEYGHQPMSNEDGTVWVIFNGEIYNHADLRKYLISKGHTYKTKTDTESIIHLYEEEDVEAFEKLNGMFAVAIWDERKHRLVLARDRLGIKPLYFARTGHSLVFGSEIKAMLENEAITPEINVDSLEEFLVFRYITYDRTAFKGITSLPPGHFLVYENGNINTFKFWDLPAAEESQSLTEENAVAALDELLNDSVNLRLMSDVPLGTMCSGGIDSSLITNYASNLVNRQFNTFSIAFKEAEFDESYYARLVSKKCRTDHHELTIDSQTFADLLPKMIWLHDEPLNHPNSVPIHHICKLAKEYITVILTGEGSDELFAGYPRYFIPRLCRLFGGTPTKLRRVAGGLFNLSPSHRFKKLGYFLPQSLEDIAVFNSYFVDRDLARSVLTDVPATDPMVRRRELLLRSPLTKDNLMSSLLYLDLKTYLVSALSRMDRMSMGASLEGRVPFLDHRLVEWGYRIPVSFKLNGMQTKYIVKKLSRRHLPSEVIFRKKSGFGVPLDTWFRDRRGLGRYLDMFGEPRFKQRGYLNTNRIDRLVADHLSGKANHGELLWELVNLELWSRTFLDKDKMTWK